MQKQSMVGRTLAPGETPPSVSTVVVVSSQPWRAAMTFLIQSATGPERRTRDYLTVLTDGKAHDSHPKWCKHFIWGEKLNWKLRWTEDYWKYDNFNSRKIASTDWEYETGICSVCPLTAEDLPCPFHMVGLTFFIVFLWLRIIENIVSDPNLPGWSKDEKYDCTV